MADWIMVALVIVLLAALLVTVIRQTKSYEKVLRRQMRLYRATCALAQFVDAQMSGTLPDDVRSLIDNGWDTEGDGHDG